MLEKVDLTKKISKEEYKEKMPQLEARIGRLQRECKAAGIPVIVVFEGMGAAGKGVQINRLIQALDPRGFDVYAFNRATEEEQMRPFLWLTGTARRRNWNAWQIGVIRMRSTSWDSSAVTVRC